MRKIGTLKFYHPRIGAHDVRDKSTACKRWRDEGRAVVLPDTRNQFEVNLGTFENTRSLGLKSFSDFPRATPARSDELKDAPIVTFCTGGTRCEKAAPWLISQGFREIYQLDRGILDYFEQCGGAHFRGDCFLFDQRDALSRGEKGWG